MSKIVILAIAFAAAFWLLRGLRKRSKTEAPPPAQSGPEDMVCCAHCGVHLPRGEAFMSQQRFFCSSQHERDFDRNS